jgi:phage tail-like protein
LAGACGSRSGKQPRISSALGIATQRGVVNATAKAMSTIGQVLGMGFTARELEDPAGAYVFSLEIDGVELAHFQDCSGIKSSTEVFEIKEGGVNHATHKLPGQSTWDNLVLSYGVTSDSSMLSLREAVLNDDFSGASRSSFPSLGGGGGQAQPKRFNGSIVIRNK